MTKIGPDTVIRHQPRVPPVTPVQVARGPVGPPGGSDASFAGFVGDSASATRAALSATYAALVAAPTGVVATDTANIQAAHDALPAGGGVLRLQRGAYRVDAITFTKPVTLLGAGGGLVGDGGLTPIRAATTIVSTSTTADCITLSGAGSTVRDLAVVNEAGSNPTAGTGIKGTAFSQGLLDAVTVLGFFNDVEVSGVYWAITNCHLYDPINHGLYVNNIGAAYQDHADAGVHNNIISMMYRTYNATGAAIRWRNGGGARISGNKLNGGAQPGNVAGKFAYGILFDPDTQVIVDVDIIGNSIANCNTAGIKLTQTGNGQVKWFNITGNQINVTWGATTPAIHLAAVDDAHVNQIGNGIVAGNVFSALAGPGIHAERGFGIHIGANRFDAMTVGPCVKIGPGGGVWNGSGIRNVSVDPQNVAATDGLPVIEDWHDWSNNGGDEGLIVHDYQRPIRTAAINTDQTIYSVAVRRHGAVMMRLTLTGYNGASGRNYVIEHPRALTRTGTGTVTWTAVGTDISTGTAAPDVSVSYDTASIPGEVLIKVRCTNAGFPVLDGRATLSMKGAVQAVRKGA